MRRVPDRRWRRKLSDDVVHVHGFGPSERLDRAGVGGVLYGVEADLTFPGVEEDQPSRAKLQRRPHGPAPPQVPPLALLLASASPH